MGLLNVCPASFADITGSGPIRFTAVIVMDRGAPHFVRHRRPVVLVEPGLILESLGRDVYDETPVDCVQGQSAPRDCVQLITDTEESSGREDCIGNPSASHVQHDVGYLAYMLAVG